MSKRKPLRIGEQRVVDRKDPTKVLGNDPHQFPDLKNNCKAAWATMITGILHEVEKSS